MRVNIFLESDVDAGVGLGDAGHLLRVEGDGAGDKLGDIEGLEQQFVQARVFLRQQEGFGGRPVRVYVGDEKAAVEPVQAAAGPDDPAAVAAPAVVTVRVRTVDFVQAVKRPVLQVDHAQVGVLVPDGETAIRRLREQQEPPVG